MSAKFLTGRLVVTKAAAVEAKRLYGELGSATRIAGLLARHAQGDWGDLNKDGKRINDEAVTAGGRLFSAYEVEGARPATEFWIITEADRARTTILLPTDY